MIKRWLDCTARNLSSSSHFQFQHLVAFMNCQVPTHKRGTRFISFVSRNAPWVSHFCPMQQIFFLSNLPLCAIVALFYRQYFSGLCQSVNCNYSVCFCSVTEWKLNRKMGRFLTDGVLLIAIILASSISTATCCNPNKVFANILQQNLVSTLKLNILFVNLQVVDFI